jgi:hypothetical protein
MPLSGVWTGRCSVNRSGGEPCEPYRRNLDLRSIAPIFTVRPATANAIRRSRSVRNGWKIRGSEDCLLLVRLLSRLSSSGDPVSQSSRHLPRRALARGARPETPLDPQSPSREGACRTNRRAFRRRCHHRRRRGDDHDRGRPDHVTERPAHRFGPAPGGLDRQAVDPRTSPLRNRRRRRRRGRCTQPVVSWSSDPARCCPTTLAPPERSTQKSAKSGVTICVSGWTTIRPPSSSTTGLKEQQLATETPATTAGPPRRSTEGACAGLNARGTLDRWRVLSTRCANA